MHVCICVWVQLQIWLHAVWCVGTYKHSHALAFSKPSTLMLGETLLQ